MKRILAPHKEQNGWRYVRVPSSIVSPLGAHVIVRYPTPEVTP